MWFMIHIQQICINKICKDEIVGNNIYIVCVCAYINANEISTSKTNKQFHMITLVGGT